MFRVEFNGKEVLRTNCEKVAYESLANNSTNVGITAMQKFSKVKTDLHGREMFEDVHVIRKTKKK